MPRASLMEASENKGRKCIFNSAYLHFILKFYKTVTMSIVKITMIIILLILLHTRTLLQPIMSLVLYPVRKCSFVVALVDTSNISLGGLLKFYSILF